MRFLKNLLCIVVIAMSFFSEKGYTYEKKSSKGVRPPHFEIQIGSEWTRTFSVYSGLDLRSVQREIPLQNGDRSINSFLSPEENLILSTVLVESGSGFYLGKHKGVHVIATNKHVLSGSCYSPQDFTQSESVLIKMSALNIEFDCVCIIGSWSDVDLTLIAVAPRKKSDEQVLQHIGLRFSAYPAELNEGLITAGHGIKNGSVLTHDISKNCRVFSDTEWVKYLRDPDTHSPSNGKVWSIAHGCNISHGDSGSALVSLETGRVLGMNWTVGNLPRSQDIYEDSFLENMDILDSRIWTDLNYGASSCSIIKILKAFIGNGYSGKTLSLDERQLSFEIIKSIIQDAS